MADTEPHAWETGRMNSITYVGLDVHKATVSVAVAEGGRGGEVRQLGVFENRPEVLSKLAARLSNKNCRISFCYEAGSCGYGLHRLLRAVASLGILEEDEARRFSLTPLGMLLRSGVPGSMRAWAILLGEPWFRGAWDNLLHSIRTGNAAQMVQAGA